MDKQRPGVQVKRMMKRRKEKLDDVKLHVQENYIQDALRRQLETAVWADLRNRMF